MWYFSWILGLGFAATFSALNAIWLEFHLDEQSRQPEIKP